MDHQQIELELQEAYEKGLEAGILKGQQDLKQQKELFCKAVGDSLAETKGIGDRRKDLILERLDFKLKEAETDEAVNPSAQSKY